MTPGSDFFWVLGFMFKIGCFIWFAWLLIAGLTQFVGSAVHVGLQAGGVVP